jgi:hypothetical protein
MSARCSTLLPFSAVDVILHFLLGELLHVPVEAREDRVAAGVRGLLTELADDLLAHAEREVRRIQRRRRGLHRDRLGIRRIGLRLGDVPVVEHRGENVGSPDLRCIGVLDRVVRGRRLRESGEKRHLPRVSWFRSLTPKYVFAAARIPYD